MEGEVIVDEYEIVVHEGAPAGHYVIELGIYLAETGERLPVYDEGGVSMEKRIVLGEVEVMARE